VTRGGRAAARLAGLAGVLAAGVCAADPLTSEALFRRPALQTAALNPSGNLSFALGFVSDTQVVTVRHTANAASTTVFSDAGLVDVEWEDDDTLIVQTDHGARCVVIDLEILEFGVVSTQHEIKARGWLIDPLPLVPGKVLWADWDGKQSSVSLVPVDELIRPTGGVKDLPSQLSRALQHVDPKYKIAQLSARVLHWISDAHGVPRAALVLENEDPLRIALHCRESEASSWRQIATWNGIDAIPLPVGLAPDGRDLLVVSAEDGGTAALRRYRVAERKLGEVIYAQPGADIAGVVFGYRGLDVIAVFWEEAGIRRYHYFDEIDAAQQTWLDQLHPGESVHLISRSADQRLFIILVSGPRNPGQLQLLDAGKRTIEELGAVMPWIPQSRLAAVSAVDVATKDGKTIEAFLTRPPKFSGERPPLVVMPHGGPIGVQDTREFDPVVQSLAAEGYAVLQVNYRGSSGKGLGFLESGMGAWGQGIEDDIEAALDTIESKHWVDADRVCIFGGSYGGYSALIGITRRPQRYRCAAAVAAPTDLLLWSNEFAESEDGRRAFAKIVGDPDRDRDHLIAISPAYRAAEMNVPILLIQGDRDRVVDPEHAFRMRAMLEANGKPYEWMLLEGASHEPTPRQWLDLMRRVDQFLAQYLKVNAPRAQRS
jgi:dipeptidyl aminopeptidase/acylaminoacyl peptidase